MNGAMWPTAFALKELDCRRRGKDHRACEESDLLRTDVDLLQRGEQRCQRRQPTPNKLRCKRANRSF